MANIKNPNKQKYKIAFLGLRSLPPKGGGSETFAAEVAPRIVKMGWEVTIYCRKYLFKKKEHHEKKYKGVKLIWLPSINSKNFDTPIHTFLSLCHIIFFHRVNVVQFGGVGNALYLPLAKIFKLNTLVILDGADWDREKWGFIAKKILKLSAFFTKKFADAIVCDSMVAQRYYKKIFNLNSIYTPYGGNIPEKIDFSILNKYNLEKEKYILFVGQLKPEKGVHLLIEGYKIAKTNFPLVIIGKNIISSYTKELKGNASDNIIFFDPIYGSDIESILAGAAFYIQPSYVEGTSPVILQNLALGQLVLANGIPENIETIGDAGISYKKNDIYDLADKITFISNDLTIKDKYKNKAINRIKNVYNWDLISKKYLETYNNLIL